MKGIILAGGSGSRLSPLTDVCSKQLLPVYDKPMIYYPLSFLMLSGVTEVLIITTQRDNATFQRLMGDGSKYGIKIEYKIQDKPSGIPEAFIIGEKFIGNDSVMLILGDNIFYGDSLNMKNVEDAVKHNSSTVFAYRVSDPERYGVVEFDKSKKVISVEEKPTVAKSNYAITGLYLFNNRVVKIAKELAPSKRGETEIVDIIRHYHEKGELSVEIFGRGVAWFDTGTVDSLLDASRFIQTIEKRQGFKIACLEEIAYRKGLISMKDLEVLAGEAKGTYKEYLETIVSIEGSANE